MSHRPPLPSFALALAFACLGTASLPAQTLHFDDGRQVPLAEARVQGANLSIPLAISGGGSAEVTLPIARVVRLDWPAPEALATAEAALLAENPAEALSLVDSVLPAHEPFRAVPGSWWAEGASLRARALAALGRDIDAEVMLGRLRQIDAPATLLGRAELAITSRLVASGRADAARPRIEAALAKLTDDTSLAGFTLLKADLLRAEKKTEPALLTYLRVPVYFPSDTPGLPAALLGAVLCLRDLGDTTRADSLARELRERFPDSPAARRLDSAPAPKR